MLVNLCIDNIIVVILNIVCKFNNLTFMCDVFNVYYFVFFIYWIPDYSEYKEKKRRNSAFLIHENSKCAHRKFQYTSRIINVKSVSEQLNDLRK